ncbi:MAG TPA: spore coat protein, partial [Maribacter sp.]|nr:spore coat protein [Maribacter sp.]
TVTEKDKVQLSAHYGLDNFFDTGCTIIDKVNREYCKKILVVLPNQSHPVHHHIKKEEAFELLHGECVLNMNGKDIQLVKGEPKIIFRGVKHSFRSEGGCVLEEVSTTHHLNDSKY